MSKGVKKQKAPAAPQADIRFAARFGRPDIATPVVAARTAPHAKWLKKQAATPPIKIAMCPGMWDQIQAGYIIPAWCDIHIKANSAGVSVRLEGANAVPELGVRPMAFEVVDGIAPFRGDVKHHVLKLESPWSVFAREGISAQVFPAMFHSDFLDKLYVYPGVVDYDKGFATVNMMFSVLEECEFTIWAGEPLLQVIPFERRDFQAECGPITERERAVAEYGFASRKPGYYRRTFHGGKRYDMNLKVDQ